MGAGGDRISRPRRSGGGRLWAILLAGGEGKRLAPVTRAVYGWDVPKQFAAPGGDRTFLQETMDRISRLVPRERTVVAVSRAHRLLAARQLADYPGTRLVLQPTNTGTTAGVLLPLAHILFEDPRAVVVVFPCDHRFRREAVFLAAVRRAVAVARRARGGIVLVGAVPDIALPDLGWILPARPGRRGAVPIKRFVEKPAAGTWALLRQGGLWNTMVMAARGRSLWNAVLRHAPAVAEPLARYAEAIGTPRADEVLGEIYLRQPRSDLSEDVMQVARGLRVVPMTDSGWSDCGTPEGLFRSLSPAGVQRLRRACRERHEDAPHVERRSRAPAVAP